MDDEFVEVSGLVDAGLSVTDEQIFYKLHDFRSLSEFVYKNVTGCHIGLIDGLPSIGKSSTLWWKLRQRNSPLLFVHMDGAGVVTTVVKVDSANFEQVKLQQKQDFWKNQLPEISAPSTGITVLVIDGVNCKSFDNARVALLNFVLDDPKKRCTVHIKVTPKPIKAH